MSDAFVVGEDFLSEHFFTTEAKNESFLKLVLERRKSWDESELPTSRSRFTAERGQLAVDLANLHADDAPSLDEVVALHDRIRAMLGFDSGEYEVEVDGPVRRYNTLGVESAAPFAMLDAQPADAVEEIFSRDGDTPFPLLTPWQRDERTVETSVTRATSALLQEEDGPEFALILAGRWLVVTEQSRWAEGRYLAVDLQTVADRNDGRRGGEIDKTLTILEAASLAPDADGQIWWRATLEESVKHTVGVSKDLREGVRRSIEIIANEVVARRRAQGLDPLPASQAQPLARQSLRFLYRILFLLYAEASPELGVLPVGATEYDAGYSLDRLRELTLVELSTPSSRSGTHFYESLDVLFRLVDRGHAPGESADGQSDGLEFHSLRADLFRPEAIALISEVRLGNGALQDVLRRLLLSKESKGRDRGFISYVDLGINQLGAVYEGLMSYTGFFAETDLYEVAKDGNAEKGSWVVPIERAEGIAEKDFVREVDELTGEPRPVVHHQGQFVFRLSGRERQQSASYYTPEVLTKFVVSQALEELLDQDGTTTTADEILALSVCEPAMGSGAFAIEAVRQLAEQYLRRRQAELGEEIPPEDYPEELQRVKAYLALHNVHGVDLNATAVEFAEITLWLDTMSRGLEAPWFGLRLRRGNSLIGARREVYSRSDVTSKAWLTTPAAAVPLADLAERIEQDSLSPTATDGRIHHFLLPAEGWGSTSESKEAKALIPDRVKRVNTWRKQLRTKPTKKQLDALVEVAYQVEELWTMALRRLMVAEQQSRRAIKLWGRDEAPTAGVVTREQIEESLADPDGAYRRLRRVMDAWCALWFWPLTGEEVEPPTWDQWIDALTGLLGSNRTGRRAAGFGAAALQSGDIWGTLADNEDFALAAGLAKPVDEVLAAHPWLRVCERVADEQGFFHWELDFAPVFGRGGFDLQVGNPPWVRPMQDSDAMLAEGDPWWQLENKPSEEARAARRAITLALPGMSGVLLDGVAPVAATSAYTGSLVNYPVLAGLQPDLYRCFMSVTWAHGSSRGIVSLLHPESHLTDEKAGVLRAATYPRLRRHWQFVNELQLFGEVHHHVSYGVHVSGQTRDVGFLNASALYHPETVVRSFHHDGSGEQPGFKHQGRWDQRPHASRIETVDDATLRQWRDVLNPELADARQTRMLYTVNREVAETLRVLSSGNRMASLGLKFSAGWHEKMDRQKGYFVQRWGAPESWDDVILQGPHLHVATPLYKQPNPTMKHNQDWSEIDFETLAPDAIPATSYKPAGSRAKYDADYTHWDGKPARDEYRLAWRAMAANTGERTLIAAIIPPGAAHPNGVFCVGGVQANGTLAIAGFAASMLLDFAVRAAPKSGIYQAVFDRLPAPPKHHPLLPALRFRAARMNCVTNTYADLWRECWDDQFTQDAWTTNDHVFTTLGDVGPEWTPDTPLRRAADRRQALVEIDALVALMLGATADQLCTVYRTQFAVLYGYDHNEYLYDANGRLVPTPVRQAWNKKGDKISDDERTHTNASGNTYVYELPFQHYDRENDMRVAYAEFERRLNTEGD